MLKRIMIVAAMLFCAAPQVSAQERFITLASTTSTDQSGLFGHLLPMFRAETGIWVRVVAVGTGQALKLGERGDADALLVHDRAGEDKFVAEGFGIDRRDVMYNDFVVVGPKADPAGVKGAPSVAEAFKRIAATKAPFASRGDDSGTHRSELRIWKSAGVDVKAAGSGWYRELGSGMGPTLNTAAGMNAYALADRGTWAGFKNRQSLVIVSEGDRSLFNPYGSILVNPARHAGIKAADAVVWHRWLTGPKGQAAIAGFKIDGEQLFFPDSK
ncbi:sulfate transporter [Paramagnetospirillum kuznetsovii]|uniref:Sulfate transporter n=1 Tax=Paramagnetospirillum kuznetsovii TaxID=2053833 RepID=A0A364NWL2_9PROT|nr:substrate-binding domain-containing protein [Paramagnetospirillum kuznetsovii]RAU21452.1 sulfate transporter [Paramagnetospirillum kuznetsovii]